MGTGTLPSEQTNGIAGNTPDSTVNCRITRHENKCNKHVTPAPSSAINTVDYYYDITKENDCSGWLSRHFDFLNRHLDCGHHVPSYYKDYGYKYISRFTNELSPTLSEQGQKWLYNARKFLQTYMEDGFKKNLSEIEFDIPCTQKKAFTQHVNADNIEALELDEDRFLDFAYATHPPAYIDGGLGDLPCSDLLKISMTPDLRDSFGSLKGLKQIIIIYLYLNLAKGPKILHSECIITLAKIAGVKLGELVDYSIEKLLESAEYISDKAGEFSDYTIRKFDEFSEAVNQAYEDIKNWWY